jgi:hypothetical protein
MYVIKRNYRWIIAILLATLPLLAIITTMNIDFSNEISISLLEDTTGEGKTTLGMLSSSVFKIQLKSDVIKSSEFKPGYFFRLEIGIGNDYLTLKDKVRSYSKNIKRLLTIKDFFI